MNRQHVVFHPRDEGKLWQCTLSQLADNDKASVMFSVRLFQSLGLLLAKRAIRLTFALQHTVETDSELVRRVLRSSWAVCSHC